MENLRYKEEQISLLMFWMLMMLYQTLINRLILLQFPRIQQKEHLYVIILTLLCILKELEHR